MLSPAASQRRRERWALTGLEVGAVLFLAGLAVLYFNPLWHLDDGGFLDHRVHWWNAAGEIVTAAGLLLEALALVGSLAVILSRLLKGQSWPYVAAGLLVLGALAWVAPHGFMRTLNARFEWNTADGFDVFRLQTWNEPEGVWREVGNPVWQSIVEAQIQPQLRNYLKMNDWQKMNGDVGVKVVRILPIAWPIDLGSGGETLQDPDETELMRAAAKEDLPSVQQLLSGKTGGNVNALDQTGQTALILACQNPKPKAEVVKALLAGGADVNLRARNGYTALTWALARNNAEVSRLLRRAGAKP